MNSVIKYNLDTLSLYYSFRSYLLREVGSKTEALFRWNEKGLLRRMEECFYGRIDGRTTTSSEKKYLHTLFNDFVNSGFIYIKSIKSYDPVVDFRIDWIYNLR